MHPGSGTLELDSGAASLPIEPDGFNDPNELITDITYMKAPEFVRMIETLMGKEMFVKGLGPVPPQIPPWKCNPGPVDSGDGRGIRTTVRAHGREVAQTDRFSHALGTGILQHRPQSDDPASPAGGRQPRKNTGSSRSGLRLADASGNDLAEVLYRVEKEEETLELNSPEPPAFISINRGYSFYGKVSYDAPLKELYLQAERDSDPVNRYIAFMTIMDREKLTMLNDPSALPDPACIDLYFRFLSDRDLMMQCGAQFLTIFESAPDKKYAHQYQALYDVRERILRSIAARHKTNLLDIYKSRNFPDIRQGYPAPGSPCHKDGGR